MEKNICCLNAILKEIHKNSKCYSRFISILIISFQLMLVNQNCISSSTDVLERGSYNGIINVVDFLPDNYVKDGTVNYKREIQKALDYTSSIGGTLIFTPMIYYVDESGLKVGSNIILSMYGAVLKVDENCQKDGFVFYGDSVTGVQFLGGEIVGRNDIWEEGINIRGIYLTGQSKNIRIRDMHIHGLTSNGIGIFGSDDYRAKDIWVSDVIIENCCNYYGDYVSSRPGPELKSDRKDQGLIAFYYVDDFVVNGCRFEKSRSDGTHFYFCSNGQFSDNKVYSAQMGGYFLESCENVTASGNIIKYNGSRGVTIERGSFRCTLIDNIVCYSGREGLWAPNCQELIIMGNLFERNGRKPNQEKRNLLWNANITINAASDPTNTYTKNYIISNNIFYTTKDQHAVIYINSDEVQGINVFNNQLLGDNPNIKIEGSSKNKINVNNNVIY